MEMRPNGRIFSTCILFKPVLGLRESAWKRKCALFLCIGHGVRRRLPNQGKGRRARKTIWTREGTLSDIRFVREGENAH